LHTVRPNAGDCIFLPAGIVHALGAGLVIAEIQQSSDVTYRLFDWNRTGTNGRPRELHIEQGLDVIDFAAGPIEPMRPVQTDRPDVQRLVDCDKFILDRWCFERPQALGGDERFHIVMVLEGACQLEGDPSGQNLTAGETALIPASLGTITITPAGSAVLLDAYLP
jgi:mannose-6-phosphate isomerase